MARPRRAVLALCAGKRGEAATGRHLLEPARKRPAIPFTGKAASWTLYCGLFFAGAVASMDLKLQMKIRNTMVVPKKSAMGSAQSTPSVP